MSIYISYQYHRMGVANSLMQYAIDNASVWGIDNITAFVFSQNLGSIKLFQKFGFEKWGHLPNIAKLGEDRWGGGLVKIVPLSGESTILSALPGVCNALIGGD